MFCKFFLGGSFKYNLCIFAFLNVGVVLNQQLSKTLFYILAFLLGDSAVIFSIFV